MFLLPSRAEMMKLYSRGVLSTFLVGQGALLTAAQGCGKTTFCLVSQSTAHSAVQTN